MILMIDNLEAGIDGKNILQGVSLTVNKGEIHSIMGPNGSGKSTLSKVLAGHPSVEVTGGTVQFDREDLLAMSPDERGRNGLFLGYQYPVEIPGVSNAEFLRMSYNAKMTHLGKEEVDPLDFDEILSEKMDLLGMGDEYKERCVNDGFSGGEKKKNEILQMALLEPKLTILDEIDSGLDIDALRIVATGVNKLMNENNALILITHYQRLLDYITPDFVHVYNQGKVVQSGGKELALELERSGYDNY